MNEALLGVFRQVTPEIVLVLAACVLFLGGTIRPGRHLWGTGALVSLALAAAAMWFYPGPSATRAAAFNAPIAGDSLTFFIRVISLGGAALLVLLSWDDLPDREAADYHACILVIVAGMNLTGAANDLITLFLALELVSIPTYVLLYLPRHDDAAQEAAMKYFLLSIFSSALLLFGFSYLYGLSGTTSLPALAEALTRQDVVGRTETGQLPGAALAALLLVVAGLGFRITAVPFHFYAPDVYQGTPTAAAALLAYVPKVAGFAALVRLLNLVPPSFLDATMADLERGRHTAILMGHQVSRLFWVVAAASMTVGNLLGLLQDNLKRLLAYSGVAHAGYMLIGLAAAPYLRTSEPDVVGGVAALLFYLVGYGAMTVGAFAVIAYLSTPERPVETVDDLAGLVRSHPAVALLMALFLFSLIGIPATAGFAGKLLLFLGAMAVPSDQGDASLLDAASLFRLLALVAVVNAAIGAWYYLRILSAIFLRNPLKPLQARKGWPATVGLATCGLLTLGLGVYPWPLLRNVQTAVAPPPAPAGAERALR